MSIKTEPVNESLYREALRFLDKGELDSAFVFFDRAKDLYLDAKDDNGVASCLIQMAMTLSDVGDYLGAQELSYQAFKYLNVKDTTEHHLISINYNNIGNATAQLDDFDEALRIYDQSIRFATDTDHKEQVLNNKAVVLFDVRRFNEALKIYEKLIAEKRTKDISYARTLTNYAKTRWRVDKSYNPLPDLWMGRDIREELKNLWGQNSSYTHLAEYYEDRNIDSAIYYARRRFDVANQLNSWKDLINAFAMLIRLEPNDSSKGLIDRYKLLQDSVNSARSLSKNQFASVRYEAEKNKVDNAQLKNSLSEKIQKINLQRVWASICGIFVLLFVVWGYVRSKQRKERMKGEAAERIKINELRTSRKVHDVVANGLYRVMSEITYVEVIDKEDVLDKIEDMYNRSRDISYEAEIGNESDLLSFDQVISSLLKSFSSVKHKVFIVGNEEAIWDGMSAMVKEDIYRVLLELMIDMRKQSRAETVLVRFVRKAKCFNITYKDNGEGGKEINGRNVILNTETRIQRMGGKIIFESKEADGLRIDIQIPVI
ncbi:tetratricopeptide repeat-containing sensor histidine kinase [Sphingobacterium nematocida]|uniref:tetratricopeptide repeat-containing sensor histidine kinase n=1 Tax=Sphingobacterium nematocida TaxID=1513896 RepID=UPI001115E693|nr:tetratricopeptide repeat-containing sensor histidine kinase [Sphingobacterium nematocida]